MPSELPEFDDQISEYNPRHQPALQENFRIREKLDDLKCEVRELSREVATSTRNDVTRFSVNPDQTVVLPERNVTLKRKTQIVNALRVELEIDRSLELPQTVSEAFLSYIADSVKDVQTIAHCVNKKINQENNLNLRVNRFENTKNNFESFKGGLKESESNFLPEMKPLIMQDFREIKEIFTRFINTVSPSGDLQTVLEELVNCSVCDGDGKYIDITEDNFLWVHTLRKTSIISKHPLRSSKICLDGF